MGGSGSGRHGGKPTIGRTRCFVLNIASLREFLIVGRAAFSLQYKCDWDELTVSGAVNALDGSPSLQLAHVSRDRSAERLVYTVSLARSYPHFGGIRWWFK
jgi:hypothetical protein